MVHEWMKTVDVTCMILGVIGCLECLDVLQECDGIIMDNMGQELLY